VEAVLWTCRSRREEGVRAADAASVAVAEEELDLEALLELACVKSSPGKAGMEVARMRLRSSVSRA